ncbi:uncharacterized protein LOC121794505 isoform X1 [Salvia splendens]|uniref:uncharacterized protein LOC121794505 isoform X1 n=1 Tax=Salvia splendens TaxID=180675 RepID=UPI001C262D85|nr:uncharacterized protein LOC121794505 isoform X1 [Salvia splendens]XP_042048623.1 uncharacterized protein LOC121794505 isoform X1 [Salvia splendens]XP_042048624.1 uncharacterized protein LOC121794505 isoform X1 [Salvia splendens]
MSQRFGFHQIQKVQKCCFRVLLHLNHIFIYGGFGENLVRVTEEKPGWCSDLHLPPCAAFVEIMAPVFSREAWRCVWHMIQNDLVHGWGLDFALSLLMRESEW